MLKYSDVVVKIRRCWSARPRPKNLSRHPQAANIICGVGAPWFLIGSMFARKVSMNAKLQLHVLEWLWLATWRRHVNVIVSAAACCRCRCCPRRHLWRSMWRSWLNLKVGNRQRRIASHSVAICASDRTWTRGSCCLC